MMDYSTWCRICGNLNSINEIDEDIHILTESIFELPSNSIRICSECNINLIQLQSMITKANKLTKMFNGLDEENKEDLMNDITRLNAYRSHFQLDEMLVIEVPEENEEQVPLKEEILFEEMEIVEEYLDDENYLQSNPEATKKEEEINPEDFNQEEEDEEEFENLRDYIKADYEKNFTFKCHLCEEPTFNRMTDLDHHCREVHQTLPKVKCCSEECGKYLSTLRRLIIHKEMHFPSETVLKCEICKKIFSTLVGFEKHKKSHDLQFVCPYCAKVFKESKTLRWHEETHLKSIDERRNFECNYCNQKFITKQACQNHIGMKHEKILSFFCEVEECRKGFYTKKALCEHRRTHGDRKFSCEVCDFRAKTKSAIYTHMDVHRTENDKNFQCAKCEMKFVSLRRLKSHLISHSDKTPYQCSHCSAVFKRSKDLKNHENTHSGIRAYSCQFCERTFTNSSNCRKHKLKDHPEELEAYESIHGGGRKVYCYGTSSE